MSDAKMTGSATPKVEVMRSHLSRARGLGAAKSGIHHWWAERVTAIALVPLTIWFVYAVLHLLGAPQAAVHAFVASPINTVLLGLQVVMEDYITSQFWQPVAILLNKAVALLLGLLCIVSILRMAFTA